MISLHIHVYAAGDDLQIMRPKHHFGEKCWFIKICIKQLSCKLKELIQAKCLLEYACINYSGEIAG